MFYRSFYINYKFKKSSGFHGISSLILKQVSEIVSPIISQIESLIFDTGDPENLSCNTNL